MALKLLIDTDPGVDDAMAILMSANLPQTELVGLTTIFGNVTVEQATRNALDLLERAGIDAPVAQGATKPLALPHISPSRHVHGEEGYGDLAAPTPKTKALDETAAEFLCRMAREHKGELVVCPVGPITNIADAIRLDPEFATNVKKIVFMGGALDRGGNITAWAEANTYHDPHALAEVIASGADVTMVGLDVTMQALLEAPDFERIAKDAPEYGVFLRDISQFYLGFYESIGLTGCGLHDPMAVIACLYPQMFRSENVRVSVSLEGETIGQTRRDDAGHEIKVMLDCDGSAVKRLFEEILAGKITPEYQPATFA